MDARTALTRVAPCDPAGHLPGPPQDRVCPEMGLTTPLAGPCFSLCVDWTDTAPPSSRWSLGAGAGREDMAPSEGSWSVPRLPGGRKGATWL